MSLARFSMQGKVAIVTGSGRGLGRAIAKGLAEAGASVVTTSRTGAEAESAAAEIKAAGGKALGITTDVSDPAACEALVQRAVATFGRLDAMLCNAGIILTNPADQATAQELEQTLKINVGGAMYCAQDAAKHMSAHGGG